MSSTAEALNTEEVGYNAVKAALAAKDGQAASTALPHRRKPEAVQDSLGATVDFDLESYKSKEECYEGELATLDAEIATAQRNIEAWRDRLGRLEKRRPGISAHLRAARAARRALEDGGDTL